MFLLARLEIDPLLLLPLEVNIFSLLDTQGIILRSLIQEVSFFSHYTPPWSHDHKCGSLAATTFAECFYAKAQEGGPQWLLPLANHLILYLRCHTVGSLPCSQMVCHQNLPPAMSRLCHGSTSFTCRGTPSTKTDCGLITLVTRPLPNFVVHRFCAVLNHTWFPTW